VGVAIAENKTIPRSEVEAAAYKAGFEAGQAAGSQVTAVASLVAKTVGKVVPKKTKPTLLGKAKKMSVVKKAVGTIKHHEAHPARRTSAAAPAQKDGKAAATGKRLGSRKTDKTADAKKEEEEKEKEKKEEEEKKKDAPLSEFLTKFSKLD